MTTITCDRCGSKEKVKQIQVISVSLPTTQNGAGSREVTKDMCVDCLSYLVSWMKTSTDKLP